MGEDHKFLLDVNEESEEQSQEDWNKAFKDNNRALATKDKNVKENSDDWEAAFSNSTQIGIANNN